MTSRFDMADALLARAKFHRDEIGDHGDSYEASLLAGQVQVELKIIVKEIFDHLRSSLDYVAREVVHRVSPSNKRSVYFPIVARGFAAEDFRGRFGQLMPGVIGSRPELVELFASFQPFSSPDNGWLADFATLCNESKHENLTVSSRDALRTLVGQNEHETTITFQKTDGSAFERLPLMLVSGWPENGLGECVSYYISLPDIDEELLWFLDRCIRGVERILHDVRDAL